MFPIGSAAWCRAAYGEAQIRNSSGAQGSSGSKRNRSKTVGPFGLADNNSDDREHGDDSDGVGRPPDDSEQDGEDDVLRRTG